VGHFAILVAILLHEDVKTEPQTSRNTTASAYMEGMLGNIASLIDTASFQVVMATEPSHKIRYFLIIAFLETTQERCLALFSF
jgi:hypothetical protein